MKRSENINELAAALAKAQKDFEAAERSHTARVETRKGGSYSFNYADLAAYLDVCREPLGNNGLSVIQDPVRRNGEVSVTSLLLHESGQWIESEPLVMNIIGVGEDNIVTPQAVGSAITYARRYSLAALIGMASEVDDDGNAASGNKAETGPKQDKPSCPICGHNRSVIRGRPEYGGGWVCFKKKDGCGFTWHDEPNPVADPLEAPNREKIASVVISAIDAVRSLDDLKTLWRNLPCPAHFLAIHDEHSDAIIQAKDDAKLALLKDEIDRLCGVLKFGDHELSLVAQKVNADLDSLSAEGAAAIVRELENEMEMAEAR